jgi:hypothetical protein
MPAGARLICITGVVILLIGATGCGRERVRLSIATPRDGQTVRSSQLDVRGRVEPANAEIRVDDKPVRTRDGAFTVPVALHRGRNRINVAATSSGRTSEIRDIIVTRARTKAQIAAARRRRAAKRAADAARAAAREDRPTGRYPQLVRETYMESCGTRASAKVCGCTLRYLEAHVSLEALQRAELRLATSGKLPGFIADAAASCRARG